MYRKVGNVSKLYSYKNKRVFFLCLRYQVFTVFSLYNTYTELRDKGSFADQYLETFTFLGLVVQN